MIRYHVRIDGPFFDSRADRAVDQYCADVRSDLATRGLVGVMTVLASPHPIGIRKRTPFYETKLNIAGDPSTDRSVRVNSMGVIYEWWLEGIGSRNWPHSKFHGYKAFAKSYQRLTESVGHVTSIHMAHALRKMN